MSFIRKFSDSSKELGHVQVIAVCAMMLALRVVLGMFANITLAFLPIQCIKISFTFIPIILTAYLFGPVCAGIVAGAGDVISYLLAPTGFGFLPWITLCYVLEGVIYGLCLYKTDGLLRHIITAKALDLLLCTLTVHSFVLYITFFRDFPLYEVILIRAAVLVPFAFIEIAFIIVMKKPLEKVQKQLHK